MPLIDSIALDTMIAGDEELLADLATMFVQFLPDLEARLRLAIETQAASEVETIFHQLRSRVSYFGATSLQQMAKQVETQAQSGNLTDIEPSCDQMLRGIDELLVELRVLTRLPLEKSTE
ncbi:Hpt domain-containing protein [Stieleria sp.]|uniref:Hpt domain-containing protein n=1 Tax=Stieleria sp. TaxID=2795976 RepID=UPI0035692932